MRVYTVLGLPPWVPRGHVSRCLARDVRSSLACVYTCMRAALLREFGAPGSPFVGNFASAISTHDGADSAPPRRRLGLPPLRPAGVQRGSRYSGPAPTSTLPCRCRVFWWAAARLLGVAAHPSPAATTTACTCSPGSPVCWRARERSLCAFRGPARPHCTARRLCPSPYPAAGRSPWREVSPL